MCWAYNICISGQQYDREWSELYDSNSIQARKGGNQIILLYSEMVQCHLKNRLYLKIDYGELNYILY